MRKLPLTLCLLSSAVVALSAAGCRTESGPEEPGLLAARATGPAAPVAVSADPWVLSTDSWNGDYRGAYLGNGMLGQRVSQTGIGWSPAAAEPAFMAGLYKNEALVSLPPLTPLEIRTGERVYGGDPSHVEEYRQELRLKEGLLYTRAGWNNGSGRVDLELRLVPLRHLPGQALLQARVENRSSSPVQLRIPAGLPEPQLGMIYRRLLPVDRPDLGSAGSDEYAVPAGETATFALWTRVSDVEVRSIPPDLSTAGVERLLADHRAAWERLWAADIEIDGDPEAQQVVRACLFHLLSSTRPENRWGVPPMGLSSPAFNGHVFWDQESWIFPALLPQHPELAAAMLRYRRDTLPGARANAKAEGLPGASYAWESASTGKETIIQQEFRHGRHVTGDLALALKQFYQATGDRAWLKETAWPILKETADNWVARAKQRGSGYVVEGVTTPDELAGVVEHSAWTHHVAAVNLRFAAETARTLGQPVNPRWEEVAKGLTYLRDEKSGLILPYRGFTEKTKAKQADVLLLAHPGEEPLSAEELGKMYDRYAPNVIPTGPAMTDAVHAILAARLGRDDEALERFRASFRPFIRPPFQLFSEKRTRDNLYFVTGAAGVVEAVLYGFAGLRLESDPEHPERPRATPSLPPDWKAVRVRNLHWRGRRWDLQVTPDGAAWTPR
ncbi:MAG: hypothetical protein ACK47B_10570 [Armatimonadota bacterium]